MNSRKIPFCMDRLRINNGGQSVGLCSAPSEAWQLVQAETLPQSRA